MSVQNVGLLAVLAGLIITFATRYEGFGSVLLIVGAAVAAIGIITRK